MACDYADDKDDEASRKISVFIWEIQEKVVFP